jgi:hypothetical protein
LFFGFGAAPNISRLLGLTGIDGKSALHQSRPFDEVSSPFLRRKVQGNAEI